MSVRHEAIENLIEHLKNRKIILIQNNYKGTVLQKIF